MAKKQDQTPAETESEMTLLNQFQSLISEYELQDSDLKDVEIKANTKIGEHTVTTGSEENLKEVTVCDYASVSVTLALPTNIIALAKLIGLDRVMFYCNDRYQTRLADTLRKPLKEQVAVEIDRLKKATGAESIDHTELDLDRVYEAVNVDSILNLDNWVSTLPIPGVKKKAAKRISKAVKAATEEQRANFEKTITAMLEMQNRTVEDLKDSEKEIIISNLGYNPFV